MADSLRDFCVGSQFERDDSLYLSEYTPCFEDFFVISTVHLVYLAVVARLMWTRSHSGPVYPIVNKDQLNIRIGLSCVVFLTTFGMLSAVVQQGEYAPFEPLSLCMKLVVWR